jgi:ribosomal protein S18 acetylase RimI-like enzyme
MSAAIRPARASDVDGLVAMEETVFASDRLSRRSLRRLIASPTAAVLVSDDGGSLAGSAIVLFRKGGVAARLYSIAVAPGRHGAGIGRALLSAALEAAAERACTHLRLEVREDNTRAIALYELSGFVQDGRRPGYYADGATALRYIRPVDGRYRPARPELRVPPTRRHAST